MDTKDLPEAKRQLEAALVHSLSEVMSTFTQETGLRIKSITIQIKNVKHISSDMTQTESWIENAFVEIDI